MLTRLPSRLLRRSSSSLATLGLVVAACAIGGPASNGGAGQGDCSAEGATEPCYPGAATTQDIGECRSGTRTCQSGSWGECAGAVLPAEEVCGDLADNDCDGVSDEGCPCEPGATRPCYSGPPVTVGIGPCAAGEQQCEGQTWSSECAGEVVPATEDPCNDVDDDCDGVIEQGSDKPECCVSSCAGKLCGADDGCSAPCKAGSGCCSPACSGKLCGAGDGCGGTCSMGSGCCSPACSGKLCGDGNGCGGTCKQGSGCCAPACDGKLCGDGDGCGYTCSDGSGCCTPSCSGASCGDSDGCTGTCSGPCPFKYKCSASNQCECGPAPSFKLVGGKCQSSCGALLNNLKLPDTGGGCCSKGCKPGTFASGLGETWDCNYCCSSSQQGVSSCL